MARKRVTQIKVWFDPNGKGAVAVVVRLDFKESRMYDITPARAQHISHLAMTMAYDGRCYVMPFTSTGSGFTMHVCDIHKAIMEAWGKPEVDTHARALEWIARHKIA